jgi:hypothetical protein
MALTPGSIQAIIEQAAVDAAFWQQLAQDPRRALIGSGIDLPDPDALALSAAVRRIETPSLGRLAEILRALATAER